jgi:dTDP-4-amino-4,6-dideoxygalactose transaminase
VTNLKAKRPSFLVFGSPAIGEDEINAVRDVMLSGWMGTGPKSKQFEEEFRAYVGREHAVAVNSCTAALFLSLHALALSPEDEVITTPLTFAATANVIEHVGARPVFVDVDPTTGLIDPERVKAAITPRTRALLPVHLYGRACEMDALKALCDEHGLALVEDCAHAIETTYRGRRTGTFGNVSCYSFYVTKNLTTVEGGMLLTDDAELAKRLKRLALHGMSADAWSRFSDEGYKHYQVVEPGYKFNMTDMQAVMGLVQMKKLGSMLERREELWRYYDAKLASLPVVLPPPAEPGSVHARHLYTILVDPKRAGITRDKMLTELNARNIGSGVHYMGQHLQPYYRDKYRLTPEHFPEATRHSLQTLSLPLSAKLTESDLDDVVAALTAALESGKS